jgi:hypothetical protein
MNPQPHEHTFYGGRTARSNEITRHTERTFAELVRNVFFRPVPLSVSRADFAEMPKDRRDQVKDGPYLTAASFDTPIRRKEHATSVELIFLDLDEDPETAATAHDIARVPETLTSALHPFNCVAYHTANSTPKAPRLRVVVEAASLPIERHRDAVALVLRRLNLPDTFKGATESNNVVLPMFRPVMFIGEDDSPVIAHRVDGRPITLDDLATPSTEEQPDTFGYEDDGAISLADLDQLPITGITVEVIRPAVMQLDPDMEYRPWLEVAAALRHQFRKEDEAREAFELFDEWSSKGTKYKGTKETFYKWKSFRPDAAARNSVTIRTIIKRAKDAGWHPDLHEPMKVSFMEWLTNASVEEIVATGVDRIAQLPEITEAQQGEYLRELYHSLRTHGRKFSEHDLRKEFNRKKGVARKEAVQSSTTEPWLQPWVYLSTEDKFVHTRNGIENALTPAAFDRTFGAKRLEAEVGEDDALPGNGKPKIAASDHANNIRQIDKVMGTMYAPESDDSVVTDYDGTKKFNTYRRHLVPELDPDPEKVEKIARMWRKHLMILCGDERIADLLHNYIAALVQHPGKKIRWAPLIQSAQGVGKTLLGELVGAAIGKPNVSLVEQSAIASGQWSDWAKDVQFIIFEEIKVPGKMRLEVMNRLKTIITNNEVQIVAKFKDSKVHRNVANVICFTNFKDAVYLEETDRRYMIVWSPIQTKEQVVELTESGHFTKLRKLLSHGGVLRYYLMHTPIPEDFPWDGPAPATEFTAQLVEESKNRLLREIEDLIENPNEALVGIDVIDYAYLEQRTALLAHNNHPARHYLMQMGYLNGGRHDINGHRTEVWWHPTRFDMSECLAPEEVLAERRVNVTTEGL